MWEKFCDFFGLLRFDKSPNLAMTEKGVECLDSANRRI